MQPRTIHIGTDMPFGRGTASCDITVMHGGGSDALFLMATNNPAAIELFYSPDHPLVQKEIPVGQIAECMDWAATVYKAPHMLGSCRNNGAEADEGLITEILLSEDGLHPPGLPPNRDTRMLYPANIVQIECAASRHRTCGELTGLISRVSASENFPITPTRHHAAVFAFSMRCAEGETFNIPQVTNVTGADTVNCTYMFIGSIFDRNNMLGTYKAKDYDPRVWGLISEPPEWLKFEIGEENLCKCSMMYMPPTQVRSSHGFSYPMSPQRGRNSICVTGVTADDRTGKRLMLFTDIKFFTVPTVCGCAIRDLVHFERAHIPLLLSPRIGMTFVFEDCPEGVRLSVDGAQMGIIRVEDRHMFEKVAWVNLTRA